MAGNIEDFNVENDVETLRRALIDSNMVDLINLFCARTLDQRMAIVTNFNETGGTNAFFADELHSAFQKLGTGLSKIIGIGSKPYYNIIARILCSLPHDDINQIILAYNNKYIPCVLLDDLKNAISEQFQRLLVEICESQSGRIETNETDIDMARIQAQEIKDVTESYNSEERPIFIDTFRTENFNQLEIVFEEFDKLSKSRTIPETIKKHLLHIFPHGDDIGYNVIVERSAGINYFYVRCLEDAFEDEKCLPLIGLVLLLCNDLEQVKQWFNANDDLKKAIKKSKLSSDLQAALRKLFNV